MLNRPNPPTTIREYIGGVWREIIDTTPAAAKVISMVGGSLFTADRFVGWFNRVIGVDEITQEPPSGIRTPQGIVIAGIFIVGVGVTNYITRFKAMKRRQRYAKSRSVPKLEIREEVENSHHHNTIVLRNIHVPTEASNENLSIWVLDNAVDISLAIRMGYKYFLLFSMAYMFNSGTSSFVSGSSIFRTGGYNGACNDENASSPWLLIPLLMLIYILGQSTVISFKEYNLNQIKIYYRNLILKGGWRKVSFLTALETFVSTGTNTLNIVLTGHRTWDIINNEILCHVGIPGIPDPVVKFLVAESALSYFSITFLMTLASVHNRNTRVQENSLTELLEHHPNYKKFNAPTMASLGIDSFNQCAAILVATLFFPADFDANLFYLAYDWRLYVPILFLVTWILYSTFAVDVESYIYELTKSQEEEIYDAEKDQNDRFQAAHRQSATLELIPESDDESDDEKDSYYYIEDDVKDPTTPPTKLLPKSPGINGMNGKHTEMSPIVNGGSNTPFNLFYSPAETERARSQSSSNSLFSRTPQHTPRFGPATSPRIGPPSLVDPTTDVHFELPNAYGL
jgi:hypothetical protein